jgi:hypothetical protein
MPEDNKCIVYWARLETHTDPRRDGYIGYSINTLVERQTSHYKKAKSNKLRNVHFHNALEPCRREAKEPVIGVVRSMDQPAHLQVEIFNCFCEERAVTPTSSETKGRKSVLQIGY